MNTSSQSPTGTSPALKGNDLRVIKLTGGSLILVVFLINPWTLSRFTSSGTLDPGRVLFASTIDIFLFSLAALLLFSSEKKLFRGVLTIVSLAAWVLVLATIAELYFTLRPPKHNPDPYDEFRVEYLHPLYYFSATSNPKQLSQINNSVVSIGPDGFRGPGPEGKGNRKLAFLVGGSSVFGLGSSSNETTISGYLNQIQEEYFFVNAGMPAWNSTQEFYRVSMELLQYKPSLIVVYNGANDASFTQMYASDFETYPPGTPLSYEALAARVEDIRANPEPSFLEIHPSRVSVLAFPQVTSRLAEYLHVPGVGKERSEPETVIPIEAADRGAAMYLWSMGNIQRLANTHGARVEFFWQAISSLHKMADTAAPAFREETNFDKEFLKRFRAYVLEHQEDGVYENDLAQIFDSYSGKVKLTDVFIDRVHLTDQGNRIVANEIWSRLSQSKQ